jgi:hypothetical protein
MTREVTEERFLKDVANHRMEIILDNGVHRHIRMKKPNSFDMFFNIVTFPHYLVYSGDMGCYVFSRVDDMFEFFRTGLRDPSRLQINEGYWAEKLEATDKPDGHKAFSSDRFKQYVNEWLDRYDFEDKLTRDDVLDGDETDEEKTALILAAKESLREQLKDYVLDYADDGETRARDALCDFEFDGRRAFQDSWEANFDEYTHRFIWCLYAIVFTIREYDRARACAQIIAKDLASMPITVIRHDSPK